MKWPIVENMLQEIPPAWDRFHSAKTKSAPFCITLKTLKFSADNINSQGLQLKLSLYDTYYKRFFGTPYNCNLSKKKLQVTNNNFQCTLTENVYFHTCIVDEAIIVAIEISGKRTDNAVPKTLGWAFFRLFSQTETLKDVSAKQSGEVRNLPLYHGTCRALLHLSDPIESNANLKIKEGAQLQFTLRTHKRMDPCLDLIPENTLLDSSTVVPGLQRNVKDPLLNPECDSFDTLILEKMQVKFQPSLAAFEEEVKELLNQDEETVRGQKSAAPDSGGGSVVVEERFLKISVHNGLTFIDEEEIVHLSSRDTHSHRRSSHRRGPSFSQMPTGEDVLSAKKSLEVSLSRHSHMLLVICLEYTVAHSTSTSSASVKSKYPLRWMVVAPFSTEGGGEWSGEMEVDVLMQGGQAASPDSSLFFKNYKNKKICVSFNGFLRTKPAVSAMESKTAPTPTLSDQPQAAKTSSPTKESVHSEEMIATTKAAGTRAGHPSQEKQQVNFNNNHQQPNDMSLQAAQMLLYTQLMQSMNSSHMFQATANSGSAFDPLRPVPVPSYFATPAPFIPFNSRVYQNVGVSRALYARLYSTGFTQILDMDGQPAEVVDPNESIPLDLGIEERDQSQSNEIVIQFLAFAHLANMFTPIKPQAVYFTFQFYRFPIITTSRLALHRSLEETGVGGEAFVLQPMLEGKEDRLDPSKPPGFMIKYSLDPNFLKPGEGRVFLEHLSQQKMHIDVWDAHSLMLIGSCVVELKALLRQGRPAVVVSYELDVQHSADCSEEDFSGDGDMASHCVGRLHVRLANIGHKISNRNSSMRVFAQHRRRFLIEPNIQKEPLLNASSKMSGSVDNLSGKSQIVLARPAAAVNRELSALLEAQRRETQSNGMRPLTGGRSVRDLQETLSKSGKSNAGQLSPREMERQRKLARLEAIEKVRCKADASEMRGEFILANQADQMQKLRELRSVQLYRDRVKHEHIKHMLHGVVTAQHTLYPAFGVAEFFEYKLTNPYNVQHNVNIIIHDELHRLTLVKDLREVRALKMLYRVDTPTEDGLLQYNADDKTFSVFLRPKEGVYIPFKYVELLHDSTGHQEKKVTKNSTNSQFSIEEHSISITFQTQDNQLLGKLQLKLAPQPPIIDQSFRFYHPEQSFLKKLLRIPTMSSGDFQANLVFARCSDSAVITESVPMPNEDHHDVMIKMPCGPSPQVRRFLVAIYSDPFLLRPRQVCHFTVHSEQRLDVTCRQGQSTALSVLLRGTESTRAVQLFSSHVNELVVSQLDNKAQQFILSAGAVHEIKLVLNPERVGHRVFHLHVVDADSHQLVRAWLILAHVKAPEVSKAFDIQLPLNGGKGLNKRVTYTNPYPYNKALQLATDRPDLLQFKDQQLEMGPGESVSIGFRFLPYFQPGTQDLLVFLNNSDGKTEDTFAVKVAYV